MSTILQVGRTLMAVTTLLVAALAPAVSVAPTPGAPSPIVYATTAGAPALLIGATRGAQWIAWDRAHSLITGGERYRLYSPTALVGKASGGKPELSQASGAAYTISLQPLPSTQSGLIGLGDSWNPLPRLPHLRSTTEQIYLDAVAAVLKQHGLAQSHPHIRKVLEVDLEGKGRASALIEAISPGFEKSVAGGDTLKPGAYSLMILRQVVAGKAQTTLLDGVFARPAGSQNAEPPTSYRISHVLDLLGDGAMEILVRSQYSEGGRIRVYTLENGHAVRVLEAPDGA